MFTARTKMTEADVDKLIARTTDIRKIPAESLNFYRDMMLGDIVKGPRSQIAHEWATRQAYIALGNLMTCAAVLGVDACPMEGFDPAEYDRVLGLGNSGYARWFAVPWVIARPATNTRACPKCVLKSRTSSITFEPYDYNPQSRRTRPRPF